MADRQSGSQRWGAEERRMMRTYLQNGWIDFARLGSVSYVDTILNGEQIWKRHMDAGKERTIRQTFRRLARDFENEQSRQDARRRGGEGGSKPRARGPGGPGRGVGFADEAHLHQESHVTVLEMQ